MRRGTLAEAWAWYAMRVLPATAGEVQRIETRRAFYAGATALSAVMVEGVGPGEPTEDDLDHVIAIEHELDAFLEELKAGRA